MASQLIETPEVSSAGGRPYSPALKVGPWVIVSGQVPIDRNGETVGLGDPAGQWRQCLDNIQNLLEAAGASMADVVLLDLFVTDMRHYLNHGEIRTEYFHRPYPASTVVAVGSLAHEDWVIEISAQAYVESP